MNFQYQKISSWQSSQKVKSHLQTNQPSLLCNCHSTRFLHLVSNPIYPYFSSLQTSISNITQHPNSHLVPRTNAVQIFHQRIARRLPHVHVRQRAVLVVAPQSRLCCFCWGHAFWEKTTHIKVKSRYICISDMYAKHQMWHFYSYIYTVCASHLYIHFQVNTDMFT